MRSCLGERVVFICGFVTGSVGVSINGFLLVCIGFGKKFPCNIKMNYVVVLWFFEGQSKP